MAATEKYIFAGCLIKKVIKMKSSNLCVILAILSGASGLYFSSPREEIFSMFLYLQSTISTVILICGALVCKAIEKR